MVLFVIDSFSATVIDIKNIFSEFLALLGGAESEDWSR